MNKDDKIEEKIQKDVNDYWEWALKSYSKAQVLNGEIDSISYPNWQKIENNLEQAFRELNFDRLGENTLDNMIFIIAQQWDMGTILNWFNKGKESISQLGMTKTQLKILCESGLHSTLIDAKSQLAASLYKIDNRELAIELLLKYYSDHNEYVRRCSLQSLHQLGYEKINPLLIQTWKENEEQGRMLCLKIWSQTNRDLFDRYSKQAAKDKREYLRNYARQLIQKRQK